MADCQPAGEAFDSRLVDPDYSVAGDPVYGLAALCLQHLYVFRGIRVFGVRLAVLFLCLPPFTASFHAEAFAGVGRDRPVTEAGHILDDLDSVRLKVFSLKSYLEDIKY